MAYELEQFCTDTRQALQQQTLASALPVIAQRLQDLLSNPAFVGAAFHEDTPPGKRQLYRDEATGFLVLAHVQQAGKGGTPHDHGDSWAVYGNARGRTDMLEYRRVSGSGDSASVLAPQSSYSIHAGQARAFPSGTIHSTAHPEKAWVLRITGTDLDEIPRYRFRKAIDTLLDAA